MAFVRRNITCMKGGKTLFAHRWIKMKGTRKLPGKLITHDFNTSHGMTAVAFYFVSMHIKDHLVWGEIEHVM